MTERLRAERSSGTDEPDPEGAPTKEAQGNTPSADTDVAQADLVPR